MSTKPFFYKRLFKALSYSTRIRLFVAACFIMVGLLLAFYSSIQNPKEKLYQTKLIGISWHKSLISMLQDTIESQLSLESNPKWPTEPFLDNIDRELSHFTSLINSSDKTNALAFNTILDGIEESWNQTKNALAKHENPKTYLRQFSKKIVAAINFNYTLHGLGLVESLEEYFMAENWFIHLPSIQVTLISLHDLDSLKKNSKAHHIYKQNLARELESLKEARDKEELSSEQLDAEINRQLHLYLDQLSASLKPISSPNTASLINMGWNLEKVMIEKYQHMQQASLDSIRLDTWWVYLFGLLTLLVVMATHAIRMQPYRVQELLKGVQELSKGNYSIRIPIDNNDEIGKITSAFNELAEQWQNTFAKVNSNLVFVGSKIDLIQQGADQLSSHFQKKEASLLDFEYALEKNGMISAELVEAFVKVKKNNQRTALLATEGHQMLEKFERFLHHLKEDSTELSDLINQINHHISNVYHMLSSIVEIADQSNLLSLNTVVKARRSGEEGRSFVVVANRVRELADQTASATLNIEKGIQEIVDVVQSAVGDIDSFSQEINSQVQKGGLINQTIKNRLHKALHQMQSFEKFDEEIQSYLMEREKILSLLEQYNQSASQQSSSPYDYALKVEALAKEAYSLPSIAAIRFSIGG